ncbi:peptide chain release factor N(5)-glutamine methyltransferase [Aquiflexum gelatinilyticum]|uniref:peptide chain release factor N(5)-glutamine methyltransferase n=1 Tax=Aquiflexum gelatinilyticum TaxID=2961943 RepID=A0A9X2SZX1_9BACT|nr:peptide chain release factor N(5)-glutamine methyltransferase [Aquiflexum gelatinilyticum]MCR9014331.1 peptide chain release factor N(5)-glutamine methyltransferase [Aquiflexum gelatinilyticum]
MTTLQGLFKDYVARLQELYPKQEAESLVFWLFEAYLGKKRMDLLKNEGLDKEPQELSQALENLLQGMPIQYILGKAPFYGREFFVSPAVLIPRNETEELVHLIIKENPNEGLYILDIGTGSGCIPITLDLEMKTPTVLGLDISEEALDIAKKNANLLQSKVDFFQIDVLNEELPFKDFDIIVSNPPYVRHSEKDLMHTNVLAYEPHLALFVYDEDPLLFYRTISQKALKTLKSGGKIYFEINEAFGKETKELMENLGFEQVKIFEDLNGRQRMIRGIRYS